MEEPLDKEEFVPDDSSGNVLTPFSRQKKAEAMYESELNEKIEKVSEVNAILKLLCSFKLKKCASAACSRGCKSSKCSYRKGSSCSQTE